MQRSVQARLHQPIGGSQGLRAPACTCIFGSQICSSRTAFEPLQLLLGTLLYCPVLAREAFGQKLSCAPESDEMRIMRWSSVSFCSSGQKYHAVTIIIRSGPNGRIPAHRHGADMAVSGCKCWLLAVASAATERVPYELHLYRTAPKAPCLLLGDNIISGWSSVHVPNRY